jgi:hypothetical protein
VIQALLRYTSIAVSAIVVLSFAMFATDQSQASSAKEVQTLGNETGTTTSSQQQQQQPAPAPAKQHGQPRQAIDDADKQILKPFNGVVSGSQSEWVKKGVPSLLALVVFGFLLNLLAGYVPKPAPKA